MFYAKFSRFDRPITAEKPPLRHRGGCQDTDRTVPPPFRCFKTIRRNGEGQRDRYRVPHVVRAKMSEYSKVDESIAIEKKFLKGRSSSLPGLPAQL